MEAAELNDSNKNEYDHIFNLDNLDESVGELCLFDDMSETEEGCKTLEMNPFVLGMKRADRALPPGLQNEEVQRKLDEYREEIDLLLKDKKVQDAKLTSSLKSIKTFWSPELKKERALRKHETARCHQTKDELKAVSKELQVRVDEMEILKQELMNLKNSHEMKTNKYIVEQESELRISEERIRDLESTNRSQADDIACKAKDMEILKRELMNLRNSHDVEMMKCRDKQEKQLRTSEERVKELRATNCSQSDDIVYKTKEIDTLKQELSNLKSLQELKVNKYIDEQENELCLREEHIKELEAVNHTQSDDISQLQNSLQELSARLNETIESQHQIILVKDEALESCTIQVEQLQKLADSQSDEIFVLQKRLEGLQASADGDIKKILAKEEEVKEAEKTMQEMQEENNRLSDRIRSLEYRFEKQEEGQSEVHRNLGIELEKTKTTIRSMENDAEEREKRISLLEDALRESVCIAAEREELLSQHIDMSDEASNKLQEHESVVDQFTLERLVTNIKNAFLILSLSEKDVTTKALRESLQLLAEKFFNWRQTALLSSISEKDSCIALFEMQPPSQAQRQEIRALVQEKDQLVRQLKELAQEQMSVPLGSDCNFNDVIQAELKDASSETIFNTTRILIDGYEKLEYYIEQLIRFFKIKDLEVLDDLPNMPHRNALIVRKPDFASREELLDDLTDVSCDTKTLRQFVDSLLNKLEED